jgi:hypothetical protein
VSRQRIGAVLVLLVAAGCGTTVAEVPAPVPPAGSAAADSAAAPYEVGPGVPRVARPRDARGIGPCELLTVAQLEAVGIDPATARTSQQNTAYRCSWRSRDKLGVFEADNNAEARPNGYLAGLSGLYAVRETFAIFEPGELDGFPIVHADRNVGSDCTIYVGVADDQMLWTAAGFVKGPVKRCDLALKLASSMLSNLPPMS